MGLACPVCGTPQRDAEHLANHLAFVAMLHADDHEDWLDANAPDWRDDDPPTLGERVAPHADEAPYETVFEDTVDGRDAPSSVPDWGPAPAAPDERTAAVLEEARRLTERMHGLADADAADADAADTDEADEAADTVDADATDTDESDGAADATDADQST